MSQVNGQLSTCERCGAQVFRKCTGEGEMDAIAFMKTIHEDLNVGPGRALKLFNDYMANKLEIAETIHADYGPDKDTGDKQILHTKSSYAKLLKRIFGPESWQKVKIWFQLVYEYWED